MKKLYIKLRNKFIYPHLELVCSKCGWSNGKMLYAFMKYNCPLHGEDTFLWSGFWKIKEIKRKIYSFFKSYDWKTLEKRKLNLAECGICGLPWVKELNNNRLWKPHPNCKCYSDMTINTSGFWPSDPIIKYTGVQKQYL